MICALAQYTPCPEEGRKKWCELRRIHMIILDPKRITQNSHDLQFPRFTAWSRESSSFCVDCTKSVSLTDAVSEWHKICSVREQFVPFAVATKD